MSNLSARLATRKFPHKDVTICLDLGLLRRRNEALRKLTDSRKRERDENRMVSSKKDTSDLVREVEAAEEQIRGASITIRVYGVDRHVYNEWAVANPPRKGKPEQVGPEFYMHAAKNSAVYVDENGVEYEITPEEWVEIDKMTDGEYDRLADAVQYVNRTAGAVDVGFFGNVSGMTRDSSETSDSRPASASRPAASGAGSPKKSTPKK